MESYGKYLWHISSEDANILCSADRSEVTPNGDLLLWGGYRKEGEATNEPMIIFALAKGNWKSVTLRDVFGGAVAIEQWRNRQKKRK